MNKIILNEQGKQKGYVIYEITKKKEKYKAGLNACLVIRYKCS